MEFIIGQTVHYTNELGDVSPAIITWITPEGKYNLTVFGIKRIWYTLTDVTNIELLPEFDAAEED